MPSPRGQIIISDMILSATAFFVATVMIFYAFNQVSAGQYEQGASGFDHQLFSTRLLFSRSEPENWSFAQHGGAFMTLYSESNGGGVNLTKAAYLVSMLKANETGALESVGTGPYHLGLSILNQSGTALNASCPACDCNGLCSVQLEFSPTPPTAGFGDVYVIRRPVRLVDNDGSGAGIGLARLEFYLQNS